jgi:hypothetical protein
MPLNVLPVIHPGALKLHIVQLETERLYQVQRAVCGGAKPRHIARVGWYFRFNQDDVHRV